MGVNFVSTEGGWQLAPNPGYANLVGSNVVIGAKYDPKREVWHVEAEIEATSLTPRLWRLRRIDGRKRGNSVLKSDAELSALEGLGRFRMAAVDPGTAARKPKVPSISLAGCDPPPVLWWTHAFMRSPGFRRSRARYEDFVRRQVERADPSMPVGTPPSFSTVNRFFLANEKALWSDPESLAIPRENGGGRPRDPWGPTVKAMIAVAVERECMLPAPRGEGARLLVKEMLEEAGMPLEGNLPSLRTMQDRMAEVPEAVRAVLARGDDAANADHGHSSIRPKPELPLEVVEADEVWFNQEVLDDETYVNIGRPVVFLTLDLKTGIVMAATVGLQVGFDLAVRGIRRSIYPWTSPFEGVVPRWFGTFGELKLDGAKYNRGDAMRNLGDRARFGVDLLPGKSPQMKGAIESFNGHFNRVLAHNGPGSLMGNVLERARFEGRRIPPLLTFGEVQGLVDDWVCNHHNVEPVENLGAFRKMKAIPDRLWRRDIAKVSRLPLEPEIFDRVTGQVEWRTVQTDGIRIDHLVYWDDELFHVVADKRHKPGKGRHRGTLYQCIRHADDSGRITFVDPYRNTSFVCRVQPVQRRYADLLPVAVHLKVVEGLNEDFSNDIRDLELRKSKAFQIAHQALSLRKTVGIEARMEAFVGKQVRRRVAGEIRVTTESPSASASMVDVTSPPAVPATELAGRTALGRPADPRRDARKARRVANPRAGAAEIDRATPGRPEAPVSTLKVDPSKDLADLDDDGDE